MYCEPDYQCDWNDDECWCEVYDYNCPMPEECEVECRYVECEDENAVECWREVCNAGEEPCEDKDMTCTEWHYGVDGWMQHCCLEDLQEEMRMEQQQKDLMNALLKYD